MLKIKDEVDLKELEKFGFKYDEDTDGYFKDLYFYYNELNPKKGIGTLWTYDKELKFSKSSLFENEFINKDNFMQKIVDKEIDDLIKADLVEKVEE